MFVVQLLGNMKIAVKYPVIVRVNNEGAICMSSNITTPCHTKHVDIRYKYVNEHVEMESADNDSNILTNNLSAELHEKYSKNMVIEKS